VRALSLGQKLAFAAQALGLVVMLALLASLPGLAVAPWLQAGLWLGLLALTLLGVAVWRGSEWARAGLMTLLGVGGLMGLHVGWLQLGGAALTLALLLLHPATATFLESRARR
jgi:hypothetical protein